MNHSLWIMVYDSWPMSNMSHSLWTKSSARSLTQREVERPCRKFHWNLLYQSLLKLYLFPSQFYQWFSIFSVNFAVIALWEVLKLSEIKQFSYSLCRISFVFKMFQIQNVLVWKINKEHSFKKDEVVSTADGATEWNEGTWREPFNIKFIIQRLIMTGQSTIQAELLILGISTESSSRKNHFLELKW